MKEPGFTSCSAADMAFLKGSTCKPVADANSLTMYDSNDFAWNSHASADVSSAQPSKVRVSAWLGMRAALTWTLAVCLMTVRSHCRHPHL